ncbi:MAG: FG-GAP-like repeat-containing protein [Candidatus Uhrbacteria bacterium]|nr:FG-GAP-like repeat-containing protein [Candidatus Uhrbacteria bacterium]
MRFRLITLAAIVGCGPGNIKLENETGEDQETGFDTDSGTETGDTSDTGEPVPGEEVTPTLSFSGEAQSFTGMAIDEGDINQDDRDDLFIGAPGVERGGDTADGVRSPGMAYLIPGPIRGGMALFDSTVSFHGITDGDGAGTSLAHGDFNHDGVMDVAIGGGMPMMESPDMAGFVAVASGPFAADVALSRSTLLSRDNAGDAFGYATSVADLTNDGYHDIAVGAPYGDEVVIYPGSPTGIGQSSTSVISGGSGMHFGDALAAGDVNGDSVNDLLIGASEEADGSEASSGAAFLFTGPFEGSLESEYATVVYPGDRQGDRTGESVSLADLDGDGYDDAIIGAPGSDSGGLDAGAVDVYITNPDPTLSTAARFVGEQPGSAAGTSVSFANDINSDGAYDIVIGAPRFDEADVIDAGRGYLVLGPIAGSHSLLEADYVVGSMVNGRLGKTVLSDTDLTGDSIADFVLAAPGTSTSEPRPIIYLIAGY